MCPKSPTQEIAIHGSSDEVSIFEPIVLVQGKILAKPVILDRVSFPANFPMKPVCAFTFTMIFTNCLYGRKNK